MKIIFQFFKCNTIILIVVILIVLGKMEVNIIFTFMTHYIIILSQQVIITNYNI